MRWSLVTTWSVRVNCAISDPVFVVIYPVGPVLIAWFNHCALLFASEIANLLITFTSHEASEVGYE